MGKDNDDGGPEQGGAARAIRGREEIAMDILALTLEQRTRLAASACMYSRYGGSHISPADLLQTAFHLAVEDGSSEDYGRRHCPVGVDIVTFLRGIMRSVSHGEREKHVSRGSHAAIGPHGQERAAVDPVDPRPSAEETMDAAKTYRHIVSLFDSDPEARLIVEGIAAGLDAEELRRKTGLNEVAYQSKRRKIRRTITRHYPKGWRS